MINQVQSNSESALSSTSAMGKADLGKDEFLNLLVTQLKHQDPLNPMDSADFTAQLAQFSSLEQLTNVNTNMEEMISAQSTMSNNQAVSYIGKNVLAYGNDISMADGVTDEISFQLARDADKVYIQIYDQNGRLVKNIEQDNVAAGKQSYEWDGNNENGSRMSDGTYNFEVYAFDGNESEIETVWFVDAPVTGITYDEGQTYLNSGDRYISIEDIFKVTEN